MNVFTNKMFLTWLIAALTFHGAAARASTDGEEVATRLTSSFQYQASSCGAQLPPSPVFECSGLLVRPTSGSGLAASAFFMRQDLPNPLSLHPDMAAVAVLPSGSSRSLTRPYCALIGDLAEKNRTTHGCWPAGSQNHETDTDPSSCAKLLVDVTYKAWRQRRDAGKAACSFSTHDGDELNEGMRIARDLHAELVMPMRVWSVPGEMRQVVKAVIFNVSSAAGKMDAYALQQKLRLQGVDVPLMAFSSTAHSFRFVQLSERDINGAVALALNKRLHTATDCNGPEPGSPAFTCSGLLARTTSHLTALPTSTITSHYFISADSRTTRLLGDNYGYILAPVKSVIDHMICIYPHNAGTSAGEIAGRSKANGYCSDARTMTSQTDFSSCAKRLNHPAISTTTDEWVRDFNDVFKSGSSWAAQCSFSVKVRAQFRAASLLSGTPWPATPWNEVVFRAWHEPEIPEIEAFFFLFEHGRFVQTDKNTALAMQQEYFKKTGRFVPVVALDLKNQVVEAR